MGYVTHTEFDFGLFWFWFLLFCLFCFVFPSFFQKYETVWGNLVTAAHAIERKGARRWRHKKQGLTDDMPVSQLLTRCRFSTNSGRLHVSYRKCLNISGNYLVRSRSGHPAVRNVVLWGTPGTVLDSWQMVGKVGRDMEKYTACI